MKKILSALLISCVFVACSNGSKGGGGGGGLSYSPTALDFGNVTKGTKSDVMGIDIKNSSSSDVVINSFSVSAPFSKDLNSTCDSGKVLKSGESCIFDVAIISDTVGAVTGTFTVNTSAGNFQTSLKALIEEMVTGKFVTLTDYPPYNARFVVTAGGVIYAVADNLQVLEYDKTANSWNSIRVRNDVMSGFSLESFSVSALGEKLYVIGGLKNGVHSNEVWEFNPANGEWRIATPSGYNYRSILHTSTTVGDKIYIIGGQGFIGSIVPDITNFIGFIDPVNGSSSQLSGTGFPVRAAHSATAIGSKIYVFGGNSGSASLNGLYVFDTETRSWGTVFADGNTNSNIEAREDAVMTTDGSNLYVFGGKDHENDVYGGLKQLNIAQSASGWSVFADSSFATPAYDATGVAYAGNIYIFGGISDTFDYKNNFLRNDLSINKFENLTRAGILTPLKDSSSVSVGSDAYFFGGKIASGYSNAFTKFSLLSRNATNVMLPDGTEFFPIFKASLAPSGQSFYLFGGSNESSNVIGNDIEQYNTANGQLEVLHPLQPSPLPPGRFAAATVVVGNKHYVIGGQGVSDKILEDTWVYDIAGKSWDNITNTDVSDEMIPLVYHSATAIGAKIYVIGGLRDDNFASDKLFVMDTTDLSVGGKPFWRNVSGGDMQDPRFGHAVAVIGETIYVFSGQNSIGSDYLNDLLKYNVLTARWESISLPNMPYSFDSGYHMYNVDGTLWFLNNYKFDLRYYRP